MSQPYDLVSSAFATSQLAVSLPGNVTMLPSVISSASRVIRRWLGRDIVAQSYDELYSGKGFRQLILRQYPINGPVRIMTAPLAVLTVTQTDTVTNQEAYASLATTGTYDTGLVVTGIQLTRTASGVIIPETPILFSSAVTIQAAADAVSAIGNGWQATVAVGYAQWATANIRAVQGSQWAMGSSGNGAPFMIHVQPLAGFSLDERRGIVELNTQTYDPAWASMGLNGSLGMTSFPVGQLNIRCLYNAGYNPIPEDIQQAALMTIQAMLYDLQTSPQYETEKDDLWEVTLNSIETKGLPKAARDVLLAGGYKSYRRY